MVEFPLVQWVFILFFLLCTLLHIDLSVALSFVRAPWQYTVYRHDGICLFYAHSLAFTTNIHCVHIAIEDTPKTDIIERSAHNRKAGEKNVKNFLQN